MPERIQIKSILSTNSIGKIVAVNGWVKTFRSNRFINLNDGSCINDLQCVVDYEKIEEKTSDQVDAYFIWLLKRKQ